MLSMRIGLVLLLVVAARQPWVQARAGNRHALAAVHAQPGGIRQLPITPLQRTVRVTGSPAGHLPHAFGSNRRLLQVLTDHDLPDSDSSNSTAVDGDEDSLWVSSLWDQPPAWLQVKNIVKAADANCPGCAEGSCVSTGDGFKCTVCMGTLMVSRADGSCGCPAGRYSPADSPNTCRDCEKSFFCLGGKYTGTPGVPDRVSCGTFSEGLTTLGLRSINKKLCVNLPGYMFALDAATGDPNAVPCPVDTFGPGLRKQRACPPCPTGFTTVGKNKQTTMNACAVAAGYFQVSPGRVAPCPRGTYKASLDLTGNCTKCSATGATTPGEASTSESNCTDVAPGLYATLVVDGAVKATAKCPQKYICPGGTARQSINPADVPLGDPTIVPCPRGMWTRGQGSTVDSLCETPPGHFTTATETRPCADGEYRSGWAAPNAAATCLKCSPDGSIASMATEILTSFKPDGTEVSTLVKGSASSCYIVGGQGLVFDAVSNTYKGVNCDNNNWGVADDTFGLNAKTVCNPCLANLITSKDRNTHPVSAAFYNQDKSNPSKGGFTGEGACVTKPGWGFVGGVAIPCEQGEWSPGDTLDQCTACGYGTTTAPDGPQASEKDCLIAPGFGFERKSIVPCPVGTYNSEVRKDIITPCTRCPGGSTSTTEGGTSAESCNLCKAGYGGAECDPCGGENPTYGPSVVPIGKECQACPDIGGPDGGGGVGGYSFVEPGGRTSFFTPRVIAAIAATVKTDCIGEFTQVSDNAWNLEPQRDSDWGGPAVTVELFTDCVQLCTYDTACQFVQFDYRAQEGNCRLKVQSGMVDSTSDILAFKAVPSSDMGASSRSRSARIANGTVSPQAVVSSGKYTFWRDPAASQIGRQVDPPEGLPLNYNSCLLSCDDDNECAGVFMRVSAINAAPTACKLIYGDKTPGIYKRTMTRMVADADHMDMYTILGAS